ncbi:MAG TPA: sigma-70 family RNA polymerase sigma factor [Lacipirellulaceae bacterium]|nr:sigma-70 family RNA polymerase sigma factor [Lacipirellulaceae bacterium]
MESSRANVEWLLKDARRGDQPAREKLLALYRPYLRLAADRQMPKILNKRADASDIAQQTLVDAVRGLDEFRGRTEPEFTAWMMKLLERNLLQCLRNHTLGKRDVRLEHNWTDESGSAQMVWHSLAGSGSSPESRVVHGETALQLAAALDKLPADQRTAVEMRYIGHESLQTIADEMGRSVGSVAGLIRRGVESIEKHLPADFGKIS